MFFFELANAVVKLRLLTTEEGGRENPVNVELSYRPDHQLSDDGFLTMGPILIYGDDSKIIELGTTVEVYVYFMPESDNVKNLKSGDKWKIFEGKKCVGECEFVRHIELWDDKKETE